MNYAFLAWVSSTVWMRVSGIEPPSRRTSICRSTSELHPQVSRPLWVSRGLWMGNPRIELGTSSLSERRSSSELAARKNCRRSCPGYHQVPGLNFKGVSWLDIVLRLAFNANGWDRTTDIRQIVCGICFLSLYIQGNDICNHHTPKVSHV